jgi:hypothetical protein
VVESEGGVAVMVHEKARTDKACVETACYNRSLT